MSNEHVHHAKHLPADLGAPVEVSRWRNRALLLALVFGLLAVADFYIVHDGLGFDYLLRGWLMGLVVCFGFTVGGLALLMVAHLSGGKWALLTRRPLEAMSATLPLVFLMFIPVGIFVKRLYLWARISNPEEALHAGIINGFQAHAIAYKRPYLNIEGFWIRGIAYFAIWGILTFLLLRWSRQRDTNTTRSSWDWQKRLENLSGAGLVIYSITLTGASIDWVMSLDPTWYSSVYGLLFLVAQGYAALSMVVLIVLGLSQYQPMKSIHRVTEQHDLGKLCFAFVMLNIYIAFSQYLIIWSGNLPDEIRWYMDRITGGWGYVIGLDFAFHWLLPFTLLLSRDIKRNKRKLATVCCIMLFARFLDTFWLIAPNFADIHHNFHFTADLLQYIFVPAAMVGLWVAYLVYQLRQRPLIALNDPHLPGILEPEHAHA